MWSILSGIFSIIVNVISGIFRKKTIEQENTELKVKAEKQNTEAVKKYHEEKDRVAKAQIELSGSNHVADKEIKELRTNKRLKVDL